MEVLQVPLHHTDEVHALVVAKVVSPAVDEQDIQSCSSSEGLLEEGHKAPPSQASPAKPPHLDVQAEVEAKGPSVSSFPSRDVAVPYDPYSF